MSDPVPAACAARCPVPSALGPLELSLPLRVLGLCLRLRVLLSGACPGVGSGTR
ncbi:MULTISPECIES: hypothetical protein [unclassified Nocardiopsis]|uniref:hypothetical protein n=1 Tax=Nocardiopsis TaxID=2013 RepID=UPI00387AB4DB